MFGSLWFHGVALGILLLGGVQAGAASLRPHNETLPLAPMRPDLASSWCGAACPGDRILLVREDLPELLEGLQLRLSGDRQQRVVAFEEGPQGLRFVWPQGFASGERVAVLLERSKTWEDLYRQGRQWIRKHTPGNASMDGEAPSLLPPLPDAAQMVALEEGDPVLQRITADPGAKTLLVRGRNLRGNLTVSYPDGSTYALRNDANATLRLPYVPGKASGLLTVARHDGRRSNPLLARFPRKVTGLVVLPEGHALDVERVEIFAPSRLAREFPAEDTSLRSDGSFTTGITAEEGRTLGIFLRSRDGSGRMLLASADVPPEEDGVLVVLSPEAVDRAVENGDLAPKKIEKP